MDRAPAYFHISRRPEMVFDVPRAFHIVRLEGTTGKFVKNGHVGLTHHVNQRVQAATVRHANGDRANTLHCGLVHNGMQGGNGDFAPFQTKAFGANVTLLTESLEPFGFGQIFENAFALGYTDIVLPVIAFQPVAEPFALLGIAGVQVFRTNIATVNAAQGCNNVLDLGCGTPLEQGFQQGANKHVAFKVLGAKAVGLRVQFLTLRGNLEPERVQRCLQMTEFAVSAHQTGNCQTVLRCQTASRATLGRWWRLFPRNNGRARCP